MSVRIHIERMVLDGPAMTGAQERQLRASVAEELTRLVREGRLSPEMLAGGRLRSMAIRSHARADANSPSATGRGIAKAVYGAIGSHDWDLSRTHGASSQWRGSRRPGA